MTNSWIRGAYVTEAKYECLRALRNLGFAIPFLFLPAALYLLFGVVFFGQAIEHDPNAGAALFLGFSVFGVMGPGLFGFGIMVAAERGQGLLTLRRALPMSVSAYLVAKMVMALLFSSLAMFAMTICAVTAAHLHFSAGQYTRVAGIDIAGSLPFCALGLYVGAIASARSAPAYVNLLYLPMIYLSGILIPLPPKIQWIARFSPAFYVNQLASYASGRPSSGAPSVHLPVLACVTIVFTVMAVRRLERRA